jgi:hypothetical protein
MKPLALALFALAGLASAGPLQVTGFGDFSFDRQDATNGYTIFFAGSFAADSVSLFDSENRFGAGFPAGGFAGGTNGSAMIDGIGYGPGFNSYSLGGGSGSITGFDSLHNPVITLDIAAYLYVTSESCVQEIPSQEACMGTFAVGTPEPGALALTLAGLGMLWWGRSRASKPQQKAV